MPLKSHYKESAPGSSSLEDRLGPPYSFKETTQNLKNGGNTVINIIMLDVDVDFKRLVLAFALLFSIEATLIALQIFSGTVEND